MAQNRGGPGVKAVETTLRILEFLHAHEGEILEDIANSVGVGTSTVHRHLVTLREHGYVIMEDGEYHLSLRFLTYGGKVRNQIPNIDLIDRKVCQITEETGERAQFIVEENGERVYIFTHVGENAVNTDATIGKRGPLHISAAGKAILANLPEGRRNEIISSTSFEGLTENSITKREVLKSELEAVKDQGYAFNNEESTEGLRAIGAPVHVNDSRILGAISISGPANRLAGEYVNEELPDLLLGAVNELELNLRYA